MLGWRPRCLATRGPRGPASPRDASPTRSRAGSFRPHLRWRACMDPLPVHAGTGPSCDPRALRERLRSSRHAGGMCDHQRCQRISRGRQLPESRSWRENGGVLLSVMGKAAAGVLRLARRPCTGSSTPACHGPGRAGSSSGRRCGAAGGAVVVRGEYCGGKRCEGEPLEWGRCRHTKRRCARRSRGWRRSIHSTVSTRVSRNPLRAP